MIVFTTEGQQLAYESVARILAEEFGRSAGPDADQPEFTIIHGSATIRIAVTAVSETFSDVTIRSWVVLRAAPTVELYAFLLEANHDRRFGAFSIDDDGVIAFTARLLGESCDTHALMFALRDVMEAADEYDEVIVQRFGGERPKDLPKP